MTTPDTSSFTPRQSDPFEPGQGGRGRRRLILILALIALAAIGSWAIFLRPRSSAPGAPKPTSTPPTSASAAPTPTPTSDPQASDNLDTAFRAIYAKRTQAIVERRPEIIDDIYRPDCNCYELKSTIQKAIQRGGRHVGYRPQVALVREIEEGTRGINITTIRAVTEQGPYTIVDDRTGKIILRDPGWAPQAGAWELHRSGPGQPWTVGFLLVEGPAEKVLGPDWRSMN